ncbi:PIF1-like helicase [Popillia japonica]|uniref:ATP-dependent DNA helicase n=1 Tax=Popillia japonica TaxID=7064 RepID=A0AAW1I831_POPJA
MDLDELDLNIDVDEVAADIQEAANRATLDLLPSKSRQQYDIAYNRFMEWCKLKKVEGKFSENPSETITNFNDYFIFCGSSGVGKSFLYNCIITRLNALEIKVISVASPGIAAALLKQGRTVYSRFQLPVPIFENSTSRITRESDDARFSRDAKFFIRYRSSKTRRHV